MNPMFIYYALNRQTPGNWKRPRSQLKWAVLLARWQGTDIPTKSRWSHIPKTLQMLSPPEGLSCLSCPGLGMGSCSRTNPRGGGMSRAWMSYVSRAWIGPFWNIRPQIYFKDLREKSSWKQKGRVMNHRTVRREPGSAAQLSVLTGPLGWILHPPSHAVCPCLCVHTSSLGCAVWRPCEGGNDSVCELSMCVPVYLSRYMVCVHCLWTTNA